MKIHPVRVMDENRVVVTIMLDANMSSPSIFFVIIYAVGVHGDASIIVIAMSSWSRKPNFIASGTNIAASPISFIKDAVTVGFIFASAFLPSKDAPIDISARGDAIAARFERVLSTILGKSILKKEAVRPRKIPIIIGFLSIFTSAFLIRAEESAAIS